LLSHVIAFLSTFAPLVMETVGWRVFLWTLSCWEQAILPSSF
jgi:hypothetical protein